MRVKYIKPCECDDSGIAEVDHDDLDHSGKLEGIREADFFIRCNLCKRRWLEIDVRSYERAMQVIKGTAKTTDEIAESILTALMMPPTEAAEYMRVLEDRTVGLKSELESVADGVLADIKKVAGSHSVKQLAEVNWECISCGNTHYETVMDNSRLGIVERMHGTGKPSEERNCSMCGWMHHKVTGVYMEPIF